TRQRLLAQPQPRAPLGRRRHGRRRVRQRPGLLAAPRLHRPAVVALAAAAHRTPLPAGQAAGPEPRPVPQDRRPARADAPVERDPGLPGEPRPDLPLRLPDGSRGGEARTGIRAAPHRRMGGAPALEVPGLRSWCWVRVSVPVAVTAVVTAGAGVALVVVTVDVGAGVA